MIQPYELRLGNLIFDHVNNRIGTVLRLNAGIDYPITYTYDKVLEHTPFKRKGLEPIPLTDDWFIKFGFVYSDLNGDTGHWQKSGFQILNGENGFSYAYELDIKFVHQLQNLYFALTHEELKTAQPQTV